MRRGTIYRKCGSCGRKVGGDHPCERCGHEHWSWAFTVDIAPPGAPRKQRTRSGFDRKRDALDAMARMQDDASEGAFVEKDSVTVGEWVLHWLKGRRGELAANTYDSYEYHFTSHIIPELGDVPLQRLRAADVKAAYTAIHEFGGKDGGSLSEKTVHNAHIAFHTALTGAVEDKILKRNPADGAHTLNKSRRKLGSDQVWSLDELHGWLAHVRQHGEAFDYALWRLAAMTGMRRGELIGLRWSSVDLERRTVTVERQITKAGPQEWGKSNHSHRTLSIDEETAAAMREWRKAQMEARLAYAGEYQASDLMFTRDDGQALDPDGTSTRFRRWVRDSRARAIRPHDLRHTHATLLLQQGQPPHLVSKRLGHASVAFTLETYSHLVPQQEQEAIDAFAMAVDR